MKKWDGQHLTDFLGTSAAVAWAVKVGLIERLADGAQPLGSLAKELESDAKALDVTLGVLESVGLVQLRQGQVALGEEVSETLQAEPGAARAHLALWRSLGDFVKSGRSALPTDGATRDGVYAHVVRALERRFSSSADALADALGPADGPILDVGAGSGVWSLAMAARDEASTVTALDGPETAEVFLGRARDRGLGERADALVGDYHEVPLPESHFARIVMANVLHLESPQRAASLVARVRPALRPGGSLVVVDAIRDADPANAQTVAVYRLHLTMRVDGSVVHQRGDFEGWMRAVGLGRMSWRTLPLGGMWALSAEAS